MANDDVGAFVNFDTATSSSCSRGQAQLRTALTTTTDVVLQIKGIGAVQLSPADGTATNGNCRGTNAVDMQCTRSGATQVASGDYSFLGGGANNMASGAYSACCGGNTCASQSTRSVCVGGTANINNGTNCALLGGNTNQIYLGAVDCVNIGGSLNVNHSDSDHSLILGGKDHFIRGTRSTILGGEGNNITNFAIGTMCAGRFCYTGGSGCFLFGDSTNDGIYIVGSNVARILTTSGFEFRTSPMTSTTTGVKIVAGGNSWAPLPEPRDRTLESNNDVQPINYEEIFRDMEKVCVHKYKMKGTTKPRLGINVEQFNKTFGFKDDEDSTSWLRSSDVDSVCLAAIHGARIAMDRLELQMKDLEALCL